MARSAKTTPPKRRLVAYVRVSTFQQSEEGYSLETQEARLRAHAVALGCELVDVAIDAGLSAKDMKRPGLQRALDLIARGEANGMVVVSLSRLTRSMGDLAELLKSTFCPGGAELVSLGESLDTSTATGRLIVNVLGSVLAWEREAAGERTAEVKAHERAKGKHLGGRPPYGFRADEDGVLVEVPEEAEVIARARRLRRTHSLADVASDLWVEGRASRSGRRFHPMQIARMLGEAGTK